MEVIVYKVKKDDTLYSIAKSFGTHHKMIYPQTFERGDRVVIKLNSEKIYIVKPLDTLQSIADKMGISVDDIVKKNGSRSIFVGKHLLI